MARRPAPPRGRNLPPSRDGGARERSRAEGTTSACRQPVVAEAEPGARDPTTWPVPVLERLQRILDESGAKAGVALRESFGRADRQMTALEFVRFWNGVGLKAMATVGRGGTPHIAPVHAEFVHGRLRTTMYEQALRRRDVRQRPAVALTTWAAHGAAAIVYGRAREIPGTMRSTRPGASGAPRRTVAIEIEVTRMYAMKARAAG